MASPHVAPDLAEPREGEPPFPFTLEQVRNAYEAARRRWEDSSRHNVEFRARYRALNKLFATYASHEQARVLLTTLPEKFRETKDLADALHEIDVLRDQRLEQRGFHRTQIVKCCPIDARAHDPVYPRLKIALEVLEFYVDLYKQFRNRWIFTSPSSSRLTGEDISWLTSELKKHCDGWHERTKELFEHFAAMPKLDPSDEGLHAGGASSHTHGQPSQSLAKPHFRPLPRRGALLQ